MSKNLLTLMYMKEFLFFIILLITLNLYLCEKGIEHFSNKQALIIGGSRGLGKKMKDFLSADYEVYVTGTQDSTENNYFKLDVKNDLQLFYSKIKDMKFDVIIDNYYSFDHDYNTNLTKNIELIKLLQQNVKKNGKFIYVSSGLTESMTSKFKDYNVIKTALERYIKLSSLNSNFSYITYRIDDTFDTDATKKLFDERSNPEDLKRSFMHVIQNGKNGHVYRHSDIDKYETNKEGVNDSLYLNNDYNLENNAIKNTKYYNDESKLTNELSKYYNVDDVMLHFGTIEFFRNLNGIFLPHQHHVLTYDYTWSIYDSHNYNTSQIPYMRLGNELVPNYDKAKINSLTRIVYLVGPLYREPLLQFIKRVDDSIIIVVDFCYDEYVSNKDYVTIKDLLDYKNVLSVNTFSKAFGRPDLRIAFSIGRLNRYLRRNSIYKISDKNQDEAILILNDKERQKKTIKYYNSKKVGKSDFIHGIFYFENDKIKYLL